MSSLNTIELNAVEKDSTKSGELSKFKFSNIKNNLGIIIINDVITIGCHLQGVLTQAEKSPFSVLDMDSKGDTSANDIHINSFIYIKEEEGVLNIGELSPTTSEDLQYMYTTSGKSPVIPAELPNKAREIISKDLSKWYCIFESNAQKMFESVDPKLAEIVHSTLKDKDIFSEMEKFYKQLHKELNKALHSSNMDMDIFIKRYAFKEHILISGPSGIGKTYSVDKYINKIGCKKEFIALHEGIESTDLLGYVTRHIDGSFVWQDGALTAAFRRALTEKTALFADELLRVPTKELNILIGALTPNSTNEYVLRTGRIIDVKDGIGTSETLAVPVENLWVIATTNMGGDYDVNEMDLALNDRFITHDATALPATQIKRILKSKNVNKLPEDVISRIVKVYSSVNSLVKIQELSYPLNIRHLSKIVTHATSIDDIPNYFLDFAPNVVSRDTSGTLNASEIAIYKSSINTHF